jgi:hypothetical protein
MIVALGSVPADIALTMGETGSCPTGSFLAGSVDLIWGNLADLVVTGSNVDLGTAQMIARGVTAEGHLLDNLAPAPREVDYYLVRESGQPDYGQSSGALPRTVSVGDCP